MSTKAKLADILKSTGRRHRLRNSVIRCSTEAKNLVEEIAKKFELPQSETADILIEFAYEKLNEGPDPRR